MSLPVREAGYVLKQYDKGECIDSVEVRLSSDVSTPEIVITSNNGEVEIATDMMPDLIDRIRVLLALSEELRNQS